EVRPEYERNSPRMSSNSYVNLKIATCLVRYADDRLIDQRFPSFTFLLLHIECAKSSDAFAARNRAGSLTIVTPPFRQPNRRAKRGR
ncbi:hypothetical protein, partial [Burkholderia multivorans]|uniref:hypothetical protein n=1 Tax=Burkholderia multivorans TaxID=87883 RepID=UPI001C244643